jgi:hypothetical protein
LYRTFASSGKQLHDSLKPPRDRFGIVLPRQRKKKSHGTQL